MVSNSNSFGDDAKGNTDGTDKTNPENSDNGIPMDAINQLSQQISSLESSIADGGDADGTTATKIASLENNLAEVLNSIEPSAGADQAQNNSEGSNMNDTQNAEVSFDPSNNELACHASDIEGMSLDGNGSLVLKFSDGSSMVIENFEALAQNDIDITLQDGSIIQSKVIFESLQAEAQKPADNVSELTESLIIELPEDGGLVEYDLEAGKQYEANFSIDENSSVEQSDGALIITLGENGQIVLKNFADAMNADTPATMMYDNGEYISFEEFLETLKIADFMYTNSASEESTIELADSFIDGPELIKPEAGEPLDGGAEETDLANIAEQLADVEPAAGGANAASGRGGYGFGSDVDAAPLEPIDAIGPIGPTALPRQLPEFIDPIGPRDGEDPASPNVSRPDDNPEIEGTALEVDETNLDKGDLSVNGTIDFSYGADGAGSIGGSGVVTSDVPLLSGGEAVKFELMDGIYVGMTTSGTIVATLVINDDGTFTYNQIGTFDHPDTTDHDDGIDISFGVNISDRDGDTANTTIEITVRDDGPVANDDVNEFEIAGGPATGNVVTGANGGTGAADDLSEDAPNTVTKVSFEGNEIDIPADGSATIEGNDGTLTINSDGSYEYIANQETVYTYNIDNPSGSDKAGDITNVSTSLNETTGAFDFSVTVAPNGGEIANGFTLAINDGPNPKGHGGEMVLFYFDASGPEPIITAYNYNGQNTLTSWNDGDGAAGNQTPDQIASSLNGDSPFGDISVSVDADGNVTFSFNADATTFQNHVPTYGEASEWSGLDFDSSIGMWLHPFNGGETSYGDDGFLNSFSIDDQSWYDTANQPTNISTHDCDVNDVFEYTLTDGDGDTSTATLTLDGECAVTVTLDVNNNVDNAFVKEDGSIFIPVEATVLHADGNEALTLTLDGVDPSWNFSGTGWGPTGVAGQFEITLATGETVYNDGFTLAPPADSDVDLSGLNVTASVSDPDTTGTISDSDGFNVVVDAVVDDPTLTVEDLNVQEWHKDYTHEVDLNIQAAVSDTDGSETITSIVIDLTEPFSNPAGGYETLSDLGFTLNMGRQISAGIWEIPVNAQDTSEALSGLQLQVPAGGSDWWPIHQSRVGGHEVKINVTAYAEETELGGTEIDFTDNKTSLDDDIDLDFYITPLVLDLDGDGVELVNADEGVQFDMDNDGIADETSWVGADDGLLALDKNGDGVINNQNELFGDSDLYEDGFSNLAQYDTNADGQIDASDDVYNDLQVWQDSSQDGISQADELYNLVDLDITSISLNLDNVSYNIGDSLVELETTFTRGDDSTGQIVDALFSVRPGTADQVDNLGTYGENSSENFAHNALQRGIDVINNFNGGEEPDVLDISDLLQNFDPVQDAIDNFVFVKEEDGGVVLSVDTEGTGDVNNAIDIVGLEGLQNLDISAMIENGNISIM